MEFTASYLIDMKPEEMSRLSRVFPGRVYNVAGYMELQNDQFRNKSDVVKITISSYSKSLVEADTQEWMKWINGRLGRNVPILGRTVH